MDRLQSNRRRAVTGWTWNAWKGAWGLFGLGFALATPACWTSTTDGPAPTDGGAPSPDAAALGALDGAPVAEGGAETDGAPPGDASNASDAGTPCVPSGTPIMHATDVTADEAWASGIHVVPTSIRVTGGARLTIEGCTEVRLGAGASISVTTTAAGLDAVGTALAPIRFVANQAGTPWGDIDVTAPAVAHLAYATLEGGGSGPHDGAPFGGASLAAQSSDPDRPVALRVDSVTISHSAGLGLFLRSARLDPASTALAITGAGWYPAYLGAGSASELPAGSYTGNAIDQILLQTYNVANADDSAALRRDVTVHDRGVPYRVGTIPSRIVVGDGVSTGPAASLTIEAGVTLLFTPQGTGGTSGILVNAQPAGAAYQPQGALVIEGTAAAPVVLDSAATAPAIGDWQGLYLAHVVDPATSIAHARILHAGGASGAVGICGSTPAANNGAATCAVVALLDQAPSGSFLASTEIEDSTCGVYRGWGKTDVDFVSGNQFVGVPGCTQTAVADSGGHCAACATAP